MIINPTQKAPFRTYLIVRDYFVEALASKTSLQYGYYRL